MNNQYMSIKDELQRRMDAAGENPNSLATKAHVTQATIWRILNGESVEPRESTVTKLARFFGVSNDSMWGRQSETAPHHAAQLPPDQAALLAAYARLDRKEQRRLVAEAEHRAKLAEIDRDENPYLVPKDRRSG